MSKITKTIQLNEEQMRAARESGIDEYNFYKAMSDLMFAWLQRLKQEKDEYWDSMAKIAGFEDTFDMGKQNFTMAYDPISGILTVKERQKQEEE